MTRYNTTSHQDDPNLESTGMIKLALPPPLSGVDNFSNADTEKESFGNAIWPRITIVTPSLNQGNFLEQTIRSVLNQNYPNLEYLIIDGGSTDQSLDIIRYYEPWLSYWVSEKDHGQSEAINKGFRMATGKYLAWLNSDDYFLPGCLRRLVQVFEQHPEAGMVFGQTEVVNQSGQKIGIFEPVPTCNFYELVTLQTILPQQAAIFRRDTYEKIGPLSTILHFAMDVEYFIRIAYEYPLIPVPDTLACYRMSSENKGSTKSTNWPHEFVQLVENFFAQPDLRPEIISCHAAALAGAYYRGGSTYLEAYELSTARVWLIQALRHNRAYLHKPGWWKRYIKTLLGKSLNRGLFKLRLELRKIHLFGKDTDWETGKEINSNTPRS